MPIIIDELPVAVSNRDRTRPQEEPGDYSPARAFKGRSSQQAGLADRWFGVYPAKVTDVVDPDSQGRVRVTLPWAPNAAGSSGIEKAPDIQVWARLATMMAGHDRGSWFIPDVDDEVLVCFQAGDPSHPIVIGSLWNGDDSPPEEMDSGGENFLKVLKTRTGNQLAFDDTDGQETISITTAGGMEIKLQDGSDGCITISDNYGNEVTMSNGEMTLNAASKLAVSATTVSIAASTVNVDSGMVRVSGVLRCDTLISNSVVSTSYTPGAGNIW